MRLCFAVLLALAPVTVFAADEDFEDLDEGGGKKRRPTDEEEEGKPTRSEIVREIERGFYLKSAIGSTSYLLTYGATPYGNLLRAGTSLSFVVGQDFVDNEKNSMAWEVAFNQGVHNGMNWQTQRQIIQQIGPGRAIQGDTRTFSAFANFEYSLYPSRRIGIGLRAGGGILFAPFEVGQLGLQQEMMGPLGTDLPVHRAPHPGGFGGPTFEYYTKLSHFSIGADADVGYTLDLFVSANGYMKYTF